MLECKLRLAQTTDNKMSDLDEIETMAREQIESCEKHPIPRPADDGSEYDFAFYIAFDTSIRAEVSTPALMYPNVDKN